MSIQYPIRSAIATAILLVLAPMAQAQDAGGDPPDRVARLAYQSGDVEFAAAGDDNWGMAEVNRPLMAGDRIGNGDDGRAVVELGAASVSIDRDSAFDLLDLENQISQFQLSQGALDMRVRHVEAGESYEVDTPLVAFVASGAGNYRVDVAPDGSSSTITVYSGAGVVYGQDGASQDLRAGRSYQFNDAQLQSVAMNGIAAPDGFDRFCANREAHYERSISRRYVAASMIGSDDLDDYGDWTVTSDYGAVWYPRQVATDWAPYHDGHWAWVDPWGWTWVDSAPWGFAPFHYGRWAFIGGRWGWIPGQVAARPVYAPALVAFVGGGLTVGVGGGGPVGWFPLGPRDVYLPPFHVSQNYFMRVNVTNVKVVNTTVINNVYVNYSAHKAGPPVVYGNRDVPGAVTVVPRTVFTGARPVAAAAIAIKPEALAKITVAPTLHIAPVAASEGVIAHPASAKMPGFSRPVVARHAPPAPPAPFVERAKAIANNGGAPLAPAQLRQMGEQHSAAKPGAAPVVLAAPKGGAVKANAAKPAVAGLEGGHPAAATAAAAAPAAHPVHAPTPNAEPVPAPKSRIETPAAGMAGEEPRTGNAPRVASPHAIDEAKPAPHEPAKPAPSNVPENVARPHAEPRDTHPAPAPNVAPPPPPHPKAPTEPRNEPAAAPRPAAPHPANVTPAKEGKEPNKARSEPKDSKAEDQQH